MMRLAVALAVLSTLNGAWTLNCYHCVSQLPLEGIEEDARLAFKVLVFQRYNVPPSLEYCDDASAYDFFYSEVQRCDDTDNCVKLSIIQGDYAFVMRGCQSLLLRPDYYLSKSTPCTNKGPSVCLCDTELCNSSGSLEFFLISFILYITYVLIW
ncbi:hypothetical protein GCK32_003736 [Trichostrongylus colubriformis]|uniref:Protein sleepless n=1 Tax=Trichostrongylus colubriformis TaxID=6319 RepID=A0AAN8FI88_TRICO